MLDEFEHPGGLWILGDGTPVYFDDQLDKNPEEGPPSAYIVLSRLLKRLIELHRYDESVKLEQVDIERIQTWLTDNRCPAGDASNDDIRMWFAALALESILAGLTLVWQGQICTALRDTDSVAFLIRTALSVEKRFYWPKNEVVEIASYDKREGVKKWPVLFSQLTRRPSEDTEEEWTLD